MRVHEKRRKNHGIIGPIYICKLMHSFASLHQQRVAAYYKCYQKKVFHVILQNSKSDTFKASIMRETNQN